MSKVCVRGFSISLDGFGAGPVQNLKNPLGIRGLELHAPVFVLTHHARPSIEMNGGTTFHFVTDGIEAALDRAKSAAGERDVKIGGGVSTIRQYLDQGAIDEIHLAISPVVLGRGEALFSSIDLPSLGYKVTEHVASENATHVVLNR